MFDTQYLIARDKCKAPVMGHGRRGKQGVGGWRGRKKSGVEDRGAYEPRSYDFSAVKETTVEQWHRNRVCLGAEEDQGWR